MKSISSRDNPLVKTLRKSAAGGGRRGEPVLLDGVHLCQAWLQHHGAPEYAVFDEEKLQRPQLQALAGRLPASACIALDARLMRELASVESGQGVLFLVHPPEPELPGRIAENWHIEDNLTLLTQLGVVTP